MKKPYRLLLQYGVTAAIGALIAWLVAAYRGFDAALTFSLNARYLSDGFFVAGLLLAGFGALIWISTTGFFDLLAYGFRSLLVLFTALVKPSEHKTFYEYKLERESGRKKGAWYILFVGLIYLAAAYTFLRVYYAAL